MVIIALFVFGVTLSSAQDNEPIIHFKVPLVEYLDGLEEQFEVEFSYNHSLLSRVYYTPSSCKDLQDCMKQLSLQLPIAFESNGDNSYLILPIRKDVQFILSDSENGIYIPYAMIQINQGPVEYVLPVKDVYTVADLFPGDVIGIQTGFYENRTVRADEYLNSTEVKLIHLKPKTTNLNEVSIQEYMTAGIDLSLEDHSLKIDMNSLGLLAGETDGDILTLTKSIPGIQSPDGKPGNINIRNSSFDHSAIYFDGIPIYHTGHFFGTISPYNPMAVNNVVVNRGTLEAAQGGKVGGLIAIDTRNDVPDTSEFQIGLNTVYAGANASTVLLKNKLGLHFSARTNYPTTALSPKMQAFNLLNFQGSRLNPAAATINTDELSHDIQFNDLQGKLVFTPNAKHQITLSAMRISNAFLYQLSTSRGRLTQTEDIAMKNQGWNLTWNGELSKRWLAEASMLNSSLYLREDTEEKIANEVIRSEGLVNELSDTRFKAQLTYLTSKSSKLHFGYERSMLSTFFKENDQVNADGKQRSESGIIQSFYTEYDWAGLEKLSIQLGLHSDYYASLEHYNLDPRLHLTYMLHRRFWLKASAGRAHQFIMRNYHEDFNDYQTSNQFWQLAYRSIPALNARQVMVGGLYQKGGYTADVELYSKETHGLTYPGSQFGKVRGTLSTQGIDVFLKKRWASIEAWISYSLSKTQISFEETVLAHFDQRHNFSAVFLFKMERFNASASWALLSGMPVYLPEIDPNAPGSNGQHDLDVPYTETFPFQHQLDLSCTYKFWKRKQSWRGVIGFSALNVYDNRNIINIFQSNPNPNVPYRYSVGFAPNVHLSLSF